MNPRTQFSDSEKLEIELSAKTCTHEMTESEIKMTLVLNTRISDTKRRSSFKQN
jgi:hypothetical protein